MIVGEMEEKNSAKAIRIGESFYTDTFKGGIKSRTSLILKITVLLIIVEMIDSIPVIMESYQEDTIITLFSVSQILIPIILGMIIFMMVREIRKWEETYNKVKHLVS